MTDPAQDDFPAPPASPLAAFVGELAGRAQAGGLRMLLAALEHVLNQQSWAREKLRAHAGRTVRLGLDAPPIASLPAPELFARSTADGVSTYRHKGDAPPPPPSGGGHRPGGRRH